MGSSSPIRPTGSIQWLLPKLDLSSRWTILGTISAEERWMAAATECRKLAVNSDAQGLFPHCNSKRDKMRVTFNSH